MFKKMLEYAGPYKRLTIQSGLVILAAVLVSILPFVFVYQIITPLIMGSGLHQPEDPGSGGLPGQPCLPLCQRAVHVP